MISVQKFRTFIRSDETGASTLEFTLLFVPMLIIAFVVVQFLLLAHAMIVIEGAAYAAARSALVNKCRPVSVSDLGENILGTVIGSIAGDCVDDSQAWDRAARIALMPISASWARDGASCNYPQAVLKLLKEDAVREGLSETLENKLCYAFTAENVQVDVNWEGQIGSIQISDGPPPITAKVTFRVPLLSPTKKIFGGRAGSEAGTYYWEGAASVTLL